MVHVHVGGRSLDSNSVVVGGFGRRSPAPPNEPYDTPDDSADSSSGAPYHAAGTPHLRDEPR